jgi:acyl carrier protein
MATAESGSAGADGATLSADAVTETLTVALAELGIGADQVQPGARLRDDLELDSTEIVQVSLELTRHLGVKVKLEDAADLTLSEVCDLVLRTAGATPADRR